MLSKVGTGACYIEMLQYSTVLDAVHFAERLRQLKANIFQLPWKSFKVGAEMLQRSNLRVSACMSHACLALMAIGYRVTELLRHCLTDVLSLAA